MSNVSSAAGSSHLLRGAGAAALIGTGLLHLFITVEYLHEKPYIGVMFALSVPLCAAAAAWVWKRGDRRSWLAGALLCSGMVAGFVASRTIGLPGFDESGVWDHWKEGFPALSAELGFIAVAARALSASVPTQLLSVPRVDDRVLANR
jgi:hypothetical protein